MKVKEFIEQCVIPNTIIRLWTPHEDGGYKPIYQGDGVKMEWRILKGKYADNDIIGVKDILVYNSNYKEAINLVIKTK